MMMTLMLLLLLLICCVERLIAVGLGSPLRPRRLPFQVLHDKGEKAAMDLARRQRQHRTGSVETVRLSSFEIERRQKLIDSRKHLVQRIQAGEHVRAPPVAPPARIQHEHHQGASNKNVIVSSATTPPVAAPANTVAGKRQYDLGYVELSPEARQARDSALLNAGASLPVNCSNLNALELKPGHFATGSTILAHSGTFRGEPVIVKKARTVTPGGATITHEVAEERFRQEAYMLIHFRHAHHVRFLGGCFERGKLTNVVQKMRPWSTVVPRPEFDWRARLCAAKRLASLVRFWSRTPDGAHVHCDFFVHQFAFDNKYTPAMIDIDGLLPVGVGNQTECKPDAGAAADKNGLADAEVCRSRCWKTPLWPERLSQAAETTLDELRCNTKTRRCVGFGVAFNVFSLGQALLQDLFLPGHLPRNDVPARLTTEIPRIVAGMTHPQIEHRWTIDEALDGLTSLYNAISPQTKCPTTNV
jgi:hypothetical protein